MNGSTDNQLLAEFAQSGSEEAFAALVGRHVNLVYSTALRFTGNPHHAQEIAQAVFIILARKAGKLSPRVVVSGWLYQTTRLTAANFIKSERRRQQREQEAYMQSTLNELDVAVWERVAPLLDEAMGSLGEADRNAVVLRFFENKTAAEIAVAMNTSQAAAHKRATRGLEKLRKLFSKRGVTLSAVAIAGAVSANSVQAAPVGLAATVTATAAQGTAFSAGIATLVKGTMKTMVWLKAKLALGVTAGVLLASGTATVAISNAMQGDREARQILERTMAKYAALQTYRSSGITVEEIHDAAPKTINGTFTMQLARPDVYRVDYEQMGASLTNKASLWSDGSGHYFKNHMAQDPAPLAPDGHSPVRYENKLPFSGMEGLKQNLGDIGDVSGGATAIVPSMFYGVEIPKLSSYVWSTMCTVQGWLKSHPLKEPDETVEGVDCFVLSMTTDEGKAWLWIGKQDGLVHRCRQRRNFKLSETTDDEVNALMKEMEQTSGKPPTMSAKEIKRRLDEARKRVNASRQATTVSFDLPQGQSGLNAIMIHPPGFRVRTQTHENIVVNEKFTPADFTR